MLQNRPPGMWAGCPRWLRAQALRATASGAHAPLVSSGGVRTPPAPPRRGPRPRTPKSDGLPEQAARRRMPLGAESGSGRASEAATAPQLRYPRVSWWRRSCLAAGVGRGTQRPLPAQRSMQRWRVGAGGCQLRRFQGGSRPLGGEREGQSPLARSRTTQVVGTRGSAPLRASARREPGERGRRPAGSAEAQLT